MLPILAQLDNENSSAKLIANRQYRQDVLFKYVGLLAGLEPIVDVRVLHLEAIVVLYKLES